MSIEKVSAIGLFIIYSRVSAVCNEIMMVVAPSMSICKVASGHGVARVNATPEHVPL